MGAPAPWASITVQGASGGPSRSQSSAVPKISGPLRGGKEGRAPPA